MTRRERRALARQKEKHAPAQPKRPSCWYWLGPCIAAFLVYLPSLSFGFVHDDHDQILNNPQITSWGYLWRLLSTDVGSQFADSFNRYYRPFFSVWMLIVRTFAGLNAAAWHFSSIALHVLATALFFWFAALMLQDSVSACVASLIFAVHPIHIEAVSWVAASNELLCAIFLLCSLVFLVRGARANSTADMWLSLAMWAGALLSKETALAVVPVFVFVLLWERCDRKRTVYMGMRYIGVAAAYLLVRMLALHGGIFGGRASVSTRTPSWADVVYSTPSVFLFYVRKLFLPVRLAPIYDIEILTAPTRGMWIEVVLIIGFLGLLAWFALRYSKSLGLAVLLIVLPLLPVIIGIHFFAGEFAHDRYLYLSSCGACLLVGLAVRFAGLFEFKKYIPAIAVTIAVCCMALCITQQGFYRSDVAYYTRALEIDPGDADYMARLGFAYVAAEDYRDARPLLERVAPMWRQFSGKTGTNVMLELGLTDTKLGYLSEARVIAEKLEPFALPTTPNIHFDLADIFAATGDTDRARRHYAQEYTASGNPLAIDKLNRLSASARLQ